MVMEYRLPIYTLVIIFNTAELILLYHQRTSRRSKLHRKIFIQRFNTVYILTSLSCADLSLGIAGTTLRTMMVTGKGYPTWAVRLTYRFSVISSVLNISLLTLDRGMAIFVPLKHRIFMTKVKLSIMIAISWIVPVATSMTAAYLEIELDIHVFHIVMATAVFPTIIIALAAYIAMFWKVRRRQKSVLSFKKLKRDEKLCSCSDSSTQTTSNNQEMNQGNPIKTTQCPVSSDVLTPDFNPNCSYWTQQQSTTAKRKQMEKEENSTTSFFVSGLQGKKLKGAISKKVSWTNTPPGLGEETLPEEAKNTCFESEHTKQESHRPIIEVAALAGAQQRASLPRDTVDPWSESVLSEKETNSSIVKITSGTGVEETEILDPDMLSSSFNSGISEKRDRWVIWKQESDLPKPQGGGTPRNNVNDNNTSQKARSSDLINSEIRNGASSADMTFQKSEPSTDTNGLQLFDRKSIRQEFRILCFGSAIVICFGICLLPATILYLIFRKTSKSTMRYFNAAFALTALNSLLNPFIYFLHLYFRKLWRYVKRRTAHIHPSN